MGFEEQVVLDLFFEGFFDVLEFVDFLKVFVVDYLLVLEDVQDLRLFTYTAFELLLQL